MSFLFEMFGDLIVELWSEVVSRVVVDLGRSLHEALMRIGT